ncbi:MAG: PaaI family thioesterase [Gammaproteobacteria bacterium]|nr:PaaI family thioesterase [Gammaproteobacteria bacterium]MCZ6722482.1 PaaI family thioesterase [Gammaproteobacteria bacterium]
MKSKFEPKYPDYVARVEKSFSDQAVMKTIGASIEAISPGKIEIEFPYQSNLTQQNGFIHAGIVSTVLDSACGYAAFSLMPLDVSVLTIEFKINLLSPATGDRFRGYGKVKKAGRTISVAEAELYAFSDQGKKLVATMVGTLMAVSHG